MDSSASYFSAYANKIMILHGADAAAFLAVPEGERDAEIARRDARDRAFVRAYIASMDDGSARWLDAYL